MVGQTAFSGKFMSLFSAPGSRFFQTGNVAPVESTSAAASDAKKAGVEVGPAKPAPKAESRLPGGPKGIPTALDKKYLVWSGQFKSADEIPRILEGEVIHRARSWGRIRMNIGFLFLAAALSGLMVYSGKQDAARGESLQQQNLDWHRQVNEDYKRQTGK